MPILLLFWASLSFADPLLDAIMGCESTPYYQEPIEYEEPYVPDEYGNNETGEGPFFYSWDNLYLDNRNGETEIIIDPYSEVELDD